MAVVFVHGILSSDATAWSGPQASWPDLIIRNLTLEQVGVYTFTYKTHFMSGSYRIGDAVDALREQLELDNLYELNALIFVCHSMGGVVVRKFILDRQSDLKQRSLTLGLFLVASPSLGSKYANLFSAIIKVFGHAQADALKFGRDNEWLNDLDQNFMNLKESRHLNLHGKELVEDTFFALRGFLREQIVPPFSGTRYFGNPVKIPESNHFSIAKPSDESSLQHRLLCKFVADVAQEMSALKTEKSPPPHEHLDVLPASGSYADEADACVASTEMAASGNPRKNVLIARATDDLLKEARSVQEYLGQFGQDVKVISIPETSLGEEFKVKLSEALKKTDLFVQLLGPHRGFGHMQRYQYDAATAAAVEIMQWRGLSLHVKKVGEEDPDHRRLLEGINVAASTLEEFKESILKWVREPQPPNRGLLTGHWLVILADQGDLETADQICDERIKTGHRVGDIEVEVKRRGGTPSSPRSGH